MMRMRLECRTGEGFGLVPRVRAIDCWPNEIDRHGMTPNVLVDKSDVDSSRSIQGFLVKTDRLCAV